MSKLKDLKRKRKAADRRRRQRIDASANQVDVSVNQDRGAVATLPSKPKADVVGLITTEILQHARGAKGGLQDVVVGVTLRGCLTGRSPSGDQSSLLWQSINDVAQQPDVSVGAFRKAVNQLREAQKKHQGQSDPGAFVAYLQLIAG